MSRPIDDLPDDRLAVALDLLGRLSPGEFVGCRSDALREAVNDLQHAGIDLDVYEANGVVNVRRKPFGGMRRAG